MKGELTYIQLYQLAQDIVKQSNDSPAFAFFNKDKIKKFYEKAGLRLQTIESARLNFIKEYVRHDADNHPMQKEQGDVMVYVFESEEKEKEYLAELEKYMMRTAPIIF